MSDYALLDVGAWAASVLRMWYELNVDPGISGVMLAGGTPLLRWASSLALYATRYLHPFALHAVDYSVVIENVESGRKCVVHVLPMALGRCDLDQGELREAITRIADALYTAVIGVLSIVPDEERDTASYRILLGYAEGLARLGAVVDQQAMDAVEDILRLATTKVYKVSLPAGEVVEAMNLVRDAKDLRASVSLPRGYFDAATVAVGWHRAPGVEAYTLDIVFARGGNNMFSVFVLLWVSPRDGTPKVMVSFPAPGAYAGPLDIGALVGTLRSWREYVLDVLSQARKLASGGLLSAIDLWEKVLRHVDEGSATVVDSLATLSRCFP